MVWLTHASEKPFAFVVDFMPAHFANSGLQVDGMVSSRKAQSVGEDHEVKRARFQHPRVSIAAPSIA